VPERDWIERAHGNVRLRHDTDVQSRAVFSGHTDSRRAEIMEAAQAAGQIAPGSWTTDDGNGSAVFDGDGDFVPGR
jgi:hypothetical protein